MKLDAPYRIQLTGTPMHHTVADMVVQSQWLFAQNEGDGLAKHGPERLAKAVNDAKREGDKEEAYKVIKDCIWPWTIRRWGETRDADGKELVKVPQLHTNDIRLEYRPRELKWLPEWVEKTKETEKARF